VLVCTTIIESGLDIPNANTIIIDRADQFGLADLYQLRGRVGRAEHKAYAYLLLPREMMAVGAARKRISAIKQYSSLGAGFRIAMRDLEIRGAGNILGTAQSGHIMSVGFDLYCQLLKQAVAQLKGEKSRFRLDVDLRLDFVATNSTSFVATKSSRRSTSSRNRDFSPLSWATACLSNWQYKSKPTDMMWPLCAVPRMLPAPRISRSRMAMRKPAPRELYCLIALIRLRAAPTAIISRGRRRYAYALCSARPTRPRS